MMNIKSLSLFFVIVFALNTNAQVATNLDAATFYSKLKQVPSAKIVDVRTPGEFDQGFIQYANC